MRHEEGPTRPRRPAWNIAVAIFLITLTAPANAYHCEGDSIALDPRDGLPKPLLLRRQTDEKWRNYNLSFEDAAEVEVSGAGPVDATTKAGDRTVSRADFDGDGEPDLLVRDLVGSEGGRWLLYTLVGGEITTSGRIKGIKTKSEWILISTADHNGDGKADILLRNQVTGAWFLYLMDGRTIDASGKLALSKKLTDVVAGTGDFNRDGRTDVLLRRANGRWLVYLIKGLAEPVSGNPAITAKPDFLTEALADFSGDGRTDLLMRNAVTGKWKLFIFKGVNIIESGPVALPKQLSFHLEAVADFSGDGIADALLRKRNGAWFLYAIDTLDVIAQGELNISRNLSWLMVATAEFTGDGMVDILLRHADGRWSLHAIDGTVPEVIAKAAPALTTFETWVPQLGCLHTDEDNDVYLGHHISTSGAQDAAREALADGISMGVGGGAGIVASESFIMLLRALGFTITETTDDPAGAPAFENHAAVRAAAAPLARIERRLRNIAIDPDRIQDEINIAEQETTDLAAALLTNPTREGNVVTYAPDPEATCALESVVSFIESLESEFLTLENCEAVLAEMSIVQTILSEDSGEVDFGFGEFVPFFVTYDPDFGSATNDLDAQRESVLLLLDIIQPMDPPTVPDVLSGEIRTTVTMDSDSVFTTAVSIVRPIETLGTSDGQDVSLAVEARDDVYIATVDENDESVSSSLDVPPITLALPVEDIADDTIFYPGEIVIPGMTGAAELGPGGTTLSITDASLGGAPITYDVNDQRALEMALAEFDLELDSDADTITLPAGLVASIDFFAVPGVADVDDAGAIAWDIEVDTSIRLHEFPETDTEEAYVVLEILRGQYDVLGTGAFSDSTFSMLSGSCYQSIDGVYEAVTCPDPAP